MQYIFHRNEAWLYQFFVRKATIFQKQWTPLILWAKRMAPTWAVPSLLYMDYNLLLSLQNLKWISCIKPLFSAFLYCLFLLGVVYGLSKNHLRSSFLSNIWWKTHYCNNRAFLIESKHSTKNMSEITNFTERTKNITVLLIIIFSKNRVIFRKEIKSL